MKAFARLGGALSGLLVGLGVAITAKTVQLNGFDGFVIGYAIGPGLVLTGLMRMKLQKALERRQEGEDGDTP
ncbi:MAG: hypothetical protein H7287_00805 [Thermoleophilia bacterium]|nr:hypothetical protein [Thermoleophilia bacterium]